MNKPEMLLKWLDEKEPRPITRESAAATIRKNRVAHKGLGIKVHRKYGETYIVSDFLGVGCCIYRA